MSLFKVIIFQNIIEVYKYKGEKMNKKECTQYIKELKVGTMFLDDNARVGYVKNKHRKNEKIDIFIFHPEEELIKDISVNKFFAHYCSTNKLASKLI